MPPTLNTSGDFSVIANRERVTLYNPLGVGQGAVPDSKRLMQDVSERAKAGGNYLGLQVDFRLPAINVSAIIQPGWMITDVSGVIYTVQDVDPPGTYNGTWNCYCLALYAINSTLQLQTPTDSTDAYLSPITTQTNLNTPVQAAIHEIDNEYLDEFQGKQGYRRHFQAWVMQQIAYLPLGSLVVDQTATVYVVGSVRNRKQIDELTLIEIYIDP
jgi:hypothetical protein